MIGRPGAVPAGHPAVDAGDLLVASGGGCRERSALRSRTISRPGSSTTGSRPGPTCRFQPPRPTTGRSGKTASSRMQEMPLARKLRAAKPQVRRARRYCASEWSFQPDCGSAKPERTHSRTSSRLMWAVGTRRWSAQYLATLVLPAPAGPMSSTARVVPRGSERGGGRGAGQATGPPGGSGTWPVVSGTGPRARCCGGAGCGRCRGRVAGPGRRAGEPGGRRRRGAGAAAGRARVGVPGGVRPATSRAAGPCPGRWGGGSGEPTACCIRCHSVSVCWAGSARRQATGRSRAGGPPLAPPQPESVGTATERYRPRPSLCERPGSCPECP